MAKKRKSRKSARRARRGGGGSQRAKFKKVSASCRAQVRESGVPAFSGQMWKDFGRCMKKGL
jgi:hypothetical protein